MNALDAVEELRAVVRKVQLNADTHDHFAMCCEVIKQELSEKNLAPMVQEDD